MTKRIDESNASGVRAAMDVISNLSETVKPYVSKLGNNWEVLDCNEKVVLTTADYDEATTYLRDNWNELCEPDDRREVDEAGEYDYRENPTSRKGEVYNQKADMPGYGRGTAKVRYVPAKSGDNALSEEKSFADYLKEAEDASPFSKD